MDFHCLTRKELQFLCKRNKIPANITNVAMADALKAIEIVEGLDEFKNQSQSPEKTMNKVSQEIPSTVTRTSTRRKTTKEEHQSTQSTIRTRKTRRRTMELDEENKNLNVPEIPVTATSTSRRAQETEPVKHQRKSDLVETPLQSCRRRPGVGSTRRKVEAQKEGSLQSGYGTRRSVRLLEKVMTGLSIKESEKMEPVKVDEMVEGEAGNNNGQSGSTPELPLSRNLSESLEDERELNEDVEENKCNNDESDGTLISEADNLDSLSALDTKDVSPNEKNEEPESEDKFADDPDGIIDSKGSDDNAVSEDSYEIVNLNEELVADETDDVVVSEDSYEIENLNEKSVADEIDDVAVSQDGCEIENLNEELVIEETKSIEVVVANAEDISEEILDHCSSADMEAIDAVSVEEHVNQAPQEIECQKLLGKDCEFNAVHDNLTILPETEEYADGEVSQNVLFLPEGHMDSSAKKGNEESDDDDDAFLGDSDIDDDAGSDRKSLADELQEEVSREQKSICIPTAAYSSEGPRTMVDEAALVDDDDDDDDDDRGNEESDDDDAFLGDLNIDNDTGSDSKYLAEDPMTNMVDEEALVDANVSEAETIPVSSFHNASQFAETAAKITSPSPCLVSNSEIITTLTPLKAQFSQPWKSSSKKQTTIPKVTQVLDNINKENIDNNSVKKDLEPFLRKVKKNKNIIDEETMQNLDGLSLRNLKKLTKKFSKLDITDNMKNKEDNKQQPFGKSRPALQSLHRIYEQ